MSRIKGLIVTMLLDIAVSHVAFISRFWLTTSSYELRHQSAHTQVSHERAAYLRPPLATGNICFSRRYLMAILKRDFIIFIRHVRFLPTIFGRLHRKQLFLAFTR